MLHAREVDCLFAGGGPSRDSQIDCIAPNANQLGTPGKLRSGEDFADFNVFGDVTPALRLGAEYGYFSDHYAGAEVKVRPIDAVNHRFQFSAFYLF